MITAMMVMIMMMVIDIHNAVCSGSNSDVAADMMTKKNLVEYFNYISSNDSAF